MILYILCDKKEYKFIKELAKNCGWSVKKLVIEAVKYFYDKVITNKLGS